MLISWSEADRRRFNDLKYFKSLKRLRSASLQEISMVPGISIKLAAEVKKTL